MGHHGFDIRDDTARSGNLAERWTDFGSKGRSGSLLVIQTHQRSILKTCIRSQIDFLIPFHNSAIAGSPNVSQIGRVSHQRQS